jgi:putative copper export protein
VQWNLQFSKSNAITKEWQRSGNFSVSLQLVSAYLLYQQCCLNAVSTYSDNQLEKLKWILKRQVGKVWTGLIWPWTVTICALVNMVMNFQVP